MLLLMWPPSTGSCTKGVLNGQHQHYQDRLRSFVCGCFGDFDPAPPDPDQVIPAFENRLVAS
jgi:hypothetical protein